MARCGLILLLQNVFLILRIFELIMDTIEYRSDILLNFGLMVKDSYCKTDQVILGM